jgi:hypothetical protein
VTCFINPYYTDKFVTLYHGDCLDVMQQLPDNSVDAIVTDPPAAISFMGKSWDGDKGGRERWSAWLAEIMREALRVTKPGGHAFVWALPRTSHWTACGVEDAGWEIRDRVVHLFGTGFPKSKNLGDGWGTALKPAAEDWWLCRKPFQGTVAANVRAHGTGALNIDGCRVPHGDDVNLAAQQVTSNRGDGVQFGGIGANGTNVPTYKPGGRWPTNVLLDGDAAAELDEQSGISQSPSGMVSGPRTHGGVMGTRVDGELRQSNSGHRDSGGASRFFPTFRYQAKAPTRERPTVVAEDGTKTAHPTVKPLALMRWLVRLVTPPGGTVLDIFAGSGATIEAAIEEGFRCIAVERKSIYLPLILTRLERAQAANR